MIRLWTHLDYSFECPWCASNFECGSVVCISIDLCIPLTLKRVSPSISVSANDISLTLRGIPPSVLVSDHGIPSLWVQLSSMVHLYMDLNLPNIQFL